MSELNFNDIANTVTKDLEANTSNTSSAPEASNSFSETHESKPVSLTDLSKLEKFVFEGKETTYKDLKNAHLRHSDYTKKTQEIAEERKYYDNLRADLNMLREQPHLINEFKKVYPEKFHAYLELVEKRAEEAQAAVSAESKPQADPELMREFNDLKRTVMEDKVAAISAKLDTVFASLSKKYPYADEEVVLAKAQSFRNHNKGELNDAKWDELFKADHDRHNSRYEERQKTKINEQQTANKKGKDIQGGGAIPGEAPKRVALKDVEKLIMSDLANGRIAN